nr:hypothetical protein OG409_00015 [Streptomyces sp. NBC_00974]
MLDCPNPPPVTVVLDPYDDVVHTRAALASHAPQHGRLTVHPTPGTDAAIALAYDILASLGKPVPLAGYRHLDPAPAWSIAAAWILATPITHLTLLRATCSPSTASELSSPCAGVPGSVWFWSATTGPCGRSWNRELRQVDHSIAEASALLPEAEPAIPERHAPRPPSNRWISLPALTTLKAFDDATARAAAPHPWRQTGTSSHR